MKRNKMPQATLVKQGMENTGHHKVFTIDYDKGNLNFLMQRRDVGFIQGDKQYSPKLFIRIGKSGPDGEFKEVITKEGKKEIPQEFRTSSLDTIRSLHNDLWKYESMLRKALEMPDETYNPARYKYMQDVNELLR